MPWYVTAFGACVAALGISLAIVFGFGINQAFAFESDGETYPNTLGGVTVTLNDTLTAPPTSICNQWWTVNIYPITGSAATPTAQTPAGAVHMWFENSQTVQSGNPWYVYFNCGQSLTGVTYIPSGLDYAARMAYDAYAGWWGLNPSVLSPTITFNTASIGANATLYTNQDFIKWLVNNSDYRARYESSDWQTPGAAVSSNIFAWEAPTTNPQFTISVNWLNNSGNYEQVDVISPAPYSGIYTIQQTGHYRFTFHYFINGVDHYETVPATGDYYVEVSTPSQIYFGEVTYTLSGKSTNSWIVTVFVYNATTVKVQRSVSGSDTWYDVTTLMQYTQTNSNKFASQAFQVAEGYDYRLIALDSNGARVYQALEFPDSGQSGTDAFEEMWDDAYNWFIDIWNTFTTLIQSFLTILPSDLANFIFVSITFLVVLGIILRVV